MLLINKPQIGRLQGKKKNKSVNNKMFHLRHSCLYNASPLMKHVKISKSLLTIVHKALHIVHKAQDETLGYVCLKHC